MHYFSIFRALWCTQYTHLQFPTNPQTLLNELTSTFCFVWKKWNTRRRGTVLCSLKLVVVLCVAYKHLRKKMSGENFKFILFVFWFHVKNVSTVKKTIIFIVFKKYFFQILWKSRGHILEYFYISFEEITFYTEILTRKVEFWNFSLVKKHHKTTFSVENNYFSIK